MSGNDEDGSQPISEAAEALRELRDRDVPEASEAVLDLVHGDLANVQRLVARARGHVDPQVFAELDDIGRRMSSDLHHLRDDVSRAITSVTDELDGLRRTDDSTPGTVLADVVPSPAVIYISSSDPGHKAIRNTPPPNHVIVVDHTVTYATDRQARVTLAEATLTTREPGRRNPYAQRTLNGKLPGDDAGHLIARALGGIGDKINLVPMLREVNRKQMARLEKRWRHAVDQGKSVDLEIELEYADDTRRPVALTISYQVADQKPRSLTLSNDAPEENQP